VIVLAFAGTCALRVRDVEELLGKRGIHVDHVTIYRWMLRFRPLLAEAPGPPDMLLVTAGRSTRPTSRVAGR
jgi:transposase-like protein